MRCEHSEERRCRDRATVTLYRGFLKVAPHNIQRRWFGIYLKMRGWHRIARRHRARGHFCHPHAKAIADRRNARIMQAKAKAP